MKTYAESQGHPPSNWLAALEPGLTTPELEKLVELAQDWPTCACGNQCDVIPRWETKDDKIFNFWNAPGRPKDEVLAQLGVDFYDRLVSARDISYYDDEESSRLTIEALNTFHQIEQRAAELIKELST